MNEYFYELKNNFLVSEKIYSEIAKGSWQIKHGFEMIYLNYSVLENTELIKPAVKFKGVINIIRMNPMSFYNWHTDVVRKSSINSLIEGYDSKCFFGEKTTDYSFESLTELPYQQGKSYLFNTQRHHSILNFKNTRYLLSIGFNETTYQDLLVYCKEHNI